MALSTPAKVVHYISEVELNKQGVVHYKALPALFFKELSEAKLIYSDIETTGLSCYYNDILLLIVYTGTGNVWVIDCRTMPDWAKQVVQPYQDKTWCFHNTHFDLQFLAWKGKEDKIMLYDIYCTYEIEVLSNKSTTEEKGLNSLATLVEKYCGVTLNKATRNSFIDKKASEEFTTDEILYAANDVIYLPEVLSKQLEIVKQKNLEYLIYLERRFLPVAVEMELVGILFDKTQWRANIKFNIAQAKVYKDKLIQELKELSKTYPKVLNQRYKKFIPKHILEKEAHLQMELFSELDPDAVLNQINFDSSQHIHKILNACGVELESTEQDLLKKFRAENLSHPICNFLYLLVGDEEEHGPSYKSYQKMISTYGEKFIQNNVMYDGRIRTSYGIVETLTGRLNSKEPNIQNIPATAKFRSAFVADEGYELLTADYSGCELVICAQFSQDRLIRESITNGLDLHSYMATISYRIITGNPNFVVSKKENKELRTKHKPVLFGLMYGAGPTRIAAVLSITLELAKKVYYALREALPEMFLFLDSKSKFAEKHNYITANTRTNRFLSFTSTDEPHEIAGKAKNFPFQATNADIIKEAICVCHAWIRKNKKDIKILLTVHDEIVFQIPKGDKESADKLVDLMKAVGNTYTPDVYMEVGAEIGTHWIK